MKLNKNDIVLIIIVLSISLIFILLNKEEKGNIAKVYYDNKLIKKIDLNVDKKYTVNGYNGKVNIVVKNKKIKVDFEKSPLHICSKQGYISKSYESIVCLPNKIVIEIDNEDKIDTVVK